jgi:23S rRNA (uracil1939-C5)-methyltransferase
VLTPDFVLQNGTPEVIITDPPRAGMSEKVIEQIIKIHPKRIVYVSCNPATQARDLALMKDFYNIVKLQPVDMFPHTHHVENVALLERK